MALELNVCVCKEKQRKTALRNAELKQPLDNNIDVLAKHQK